MLSSTVVPQHWFCVFGCWLFVVVAAENDGKRTGHLFPKVDARRRMLEEATEIPEMDSPEYWAQQEMMMDEGSSIAAQFTEFEQTVDDTTLICEGEVTLYRLSCPLDACDDNDGEDAGQKQGSGCDSSRCKASFCQLDFDLQKEHPERYPSLLDLVGASAHCDSAPITVEFNDIVQECRKYDLRKTEALPHAVPLAGLVTELGYTDAELMTNAMTAQSAANRVLVDPQPVYEAMTMCDDYRKRRQRHIRQVTTECSRARSASLLQDVVYLYSRTRDAAEQRLFLKVAPAAVTGLDVFETAFRDVPWVFVYDEPREAIGAQVMGRFKPERAACVATKKDPPSELKQMVPGVGVEWTTADYCAAWLAMLAETAWQRTRASGRGRLIKSKDVLTLLGDVMTTQFNVQDFQRYAPNNVATLGLVTVDGNTDMNLQTKLKEKKLAKVTKEYEEASAKYYRGVFEKMEQLGNGVEKKFDWAAFFQSLMVGMIEPKP